MVDSELDPKSKRESNRTRAKFDWRPMRFISAKRKEIGGVPPTHGSATSRPPVSSAWAKVSPSTCRGDLPLETQVFLMRLLLWKTERHVNRR